MPKENDFEKLYPAVVFSKKRLITILEEEDDLEEGYGTEKIVESIKNMDSEGMWGLAERFENYYEGDTNNYFGGGQLFVNAVLSVFSNDFLCPEYEEGD